jgi:DNA-binding response OmpR family regulator
MAGSFPLECPYCGRPLRWVPLRWFGRGCFECAACGEFPDLAGARASSRAAPGPGDTPSRPPKRGDRPRILLVDDSAEHRDLYALMLEPTATVVTASRGDEALVIARAEPLDAIVVDVLMPGMSGWELCARLTADDKTRDVPVIVLTSLDGVDAAAPGHDAGAAAVLMKPCPVERLAATIDAALRRQTAADEPPRATATPAVERWPAAMASARILVVDGEPECAALAAPLRDAGYRVRAAHTFHDGVRALEEDHPDLLVAAVRLGDFNGLQLLVTGERRFPAIIVSDAGSGLERDARQLGAEYLEKPVDALALIGAVDRALGKSSSRFAAARRWRRKAITSVLPARVDRLPAHLVDVSYGGLCVEIEEADDRIPLSFDLTLPISQVSVRADAVWMTRGDGHTWRCGAQLSDASTEWRELVDHVS